MKKQATLELKPEQINNVELIRKIAARLCHANLSEITGIDYLKPQIMLAQQNVKALGAGNIEFLAVDALKYE